jgi:hypothetical protein
MVRLPEEAAMVVSTFVGVAIGILLSLAAGVTTAPVDRQQPSHLTVIFPTAPPTATPTRTPLPTKEPTKTPSPTPTNLPWPYCDQAQPGEACVPSSLITPTPTPTFPPCSQGRTFVAGGTWVCTKDLPSPATPSS